MEYFVVWFLVCLHENLKKTISSSSTKRQKRKINRDQTGFYVIGGVAFFVGMAFMAMLFLWFGGNNLFNRWLIDWLIKINF